ncbi:MAG TPA: nucleotidyl transferase AbiEii/AbiGii toxin family protein [Dehalococcoidia bacterium]|nr:nucleotidyl transferase AbiEii/AbiGii toxin family protein [Dehalococcoidia bacterium]
MRYATASAFRAALEQRLATTAQQTGVPLLRLRKLVVFDRLMARLLITAPDRWVLKGAVALQFRLGPRFRTTKDMDLGRRDSAEAATADFLAVQSVHLDDYFTFAIERTGQLDLTTEGATVRYHATAQLAGRRFEDVTIDVAFGDPIVAAPELLEGPDLLGFAGIPPIVVPALPLEQHVAEKLHAYTRRYASGIASTRAKDLIDLVAMSSLSAFQAGRLRLALEATFAARGTHHLPGSLPPPPSEWRIAYRRIAIEAGLERGMEVGYEHAKAFLGPVLAGTIPDLALWDPGRRAW